MPETITHAELVERARDAVARSGLTQTELARRIGKRQPHVSRALGHPSTKDTSTLLRIVELVFGEEWEGVTVYRLR